MKFTVLTALMVLTLAAITSGDVVMLEDFEDSSIAYSGPADSVDDIANDDYYGRVSLSASPQLSGSVSYSNVQGTYFYGVQDPDSALPTALPSSGPSSIDLDFSVDISNYENLTFDFFVAEDVAGDGGNDWDNADEFLVSYGIDAPATTNNLFAISGTGGTNVSGAVDTNFDGVGDGALITDVFTNYQVPILGTGSTLNLRISFFRTGTDSQLWAGDEDLAIDNIRIQGRAIPVPEPSSFLFLGLLTGVGLVYRRLQVFTHLAG